MGNVADDVEVDWEGEELVDNDEDHVMSPITDVL